VEDKAERLKGERPQEFVVTLFAKNAISPAYPFAILEESNALLADDLGAVCQPEFLFRQRLDTELLQNGGGNHGIDGPRIDQEIHLLCHFRVSRVSNFNFQYCQSHRILFILSS